MLRPSCLVALLFSVAVVELGCGLLLDVDPPSPKSDGAVGEDGGSGVCQNGDPCDTGIPCELGTLVCDDGGGRTCVASGPAPAGTVCRDARDACDEAEVCDGVSVDCPSDALLPSGATCRAASSECDVEELCDGGSESCPTDVFAPLGTTCAIGFCDTTGMCSDRCVEGDRCMTSYPCERATVVCDGARPTCPSTGDPASPTTVCRMVAGACDVEETCDGVGIDCPADVHFSTDVVCRPSGGMCDVEETCDGGNSCPSDGVLPSGGLCRMPATSCENEAACDGASSVCPPNTRMPMGMACSAGGFPGMCNVMGVCVPTVCVSGVACNTDCASGVVDCSLGAPVCTPTTPYAAGTPCRPVTSPACDSPEVCDGVSSECPPDVWVPDDYPCSSCGTWQCRAGVCRSTTIDPDPGTCPATQYCCPWGCSSMFCF